MAKFSLKDRFIAVTGAGGLLGREHCRAIAGIGGIPLLLDLDKERIDILASSLRVEFAIDAPVFELDICDELQVKSLADQIKNTCGRLDGLVNNAARNPTMDGDEATKSSTRLEEFLVSEWDQDFAVGVTGAFLCVKHLAPIMIRSGGGSIVNVSSDLGIIAPDQRLYSEYPGEKNQKNVKPVSYSVTKHALIGLTKYISTYWTNEKIRANTLCPGGIQNGQDHALVERIERLIPMGRMARPDDYHGALQFLLSDASEYLNGHTLIVDGGRTVW